MAYKFKKHFLSLYFSVACVAVLGQDAEVKKEKDKRPVRDPFESSYLINNQTIVVPKAKTLEFVIQHRFGTLNSEQFDLLGMYAPSNIRIGLNYSIFDRFQFGIGTTKNYKLQDINLKIALLRQTRSGTMPLAVTYSGITAIDVRGGDIFPQITNRLSYSHQVMIGRKFTKRISLQLTPSYSHFNIVDSLMKHDNFAISFNGRVKVLDLMNIIFEYDQQLTKQEINQPKPNIGIGVEFITSAHAFQVFVSSFGSIINQYNVLYNSNDFLNGGILIGFNMTRLWNL